MTPEMLRELSRLHAEVFVARVRLYQALQRLDPNLSVKELEREDREHIEAFAKCFLTERLGQEESSPVPKTPDIPPRPF